MTALSRINGFDVLPFKRRLIEEASKTYAAAYNGLPWQEKWTHKRACKRLKQIFRSKKRDREGYLVIDADGSVIGLTIGLYKWWDKGRRFYIEDFVVRPENQGQKIGEQLLDRLVQAAFRNGAFEIVLDTKPGAPVERLFRRKGFAEGNLMMVLGRGPEV